MSCCLGRVFVGGFGFRLRGSVDGGDDGDSVRPCCMLLEGVELAATLQRRCPCGAVRQHQAHQNGTHAEPGLFLVAPQVLHRSYAAVCAVEHRSYATVRAPADVRLLSDSSNSRSGCAKRSSIRSTRDADVNAFATKSHSDRVEVPDKLSG
jgi:hypothetical protein